MTAFDLSSLTEALDGVQCNANLNGQLQRCTERNCPVFNYNDIDTHLCTLHETYIRGAIFRRRFPGFETTALVSGDQSIPSVAESVTENIRIVRGNQSTTVFSGAHLDKLTAGMHHGIKAGILHYISDYILFLGDSSDKHDILSNSKSHFGVRYRQHALKKDGKVDSRYLQTFLNECRRSGCVWLVQVDPTADAIKKMDAEGQEASDGLAVMVGFTSNLVKRLGDIRECSTNQSALATFPNTPSYKRKGQRPLPLVELLAGIVHEILVAHQHDIWCRPHQPNGRAHTQVYWFQNLKGAAPFEELMNVLAPIIQQWLNALRDLHKRVGHLL